MMRVCRWALYGLVAIICVSALREAAGQPGVEKASADTLQAILDRIHRHAADDAWRETGWKDDPIEGWLDKVIGSIAKSAELPDLKLPVRMSEVRPAESDKGRAFSKALLVGKGMDLKSARLRNSIVLADGNVEVESLEGCVVVARGAVSVAKTTSSVIVAGAYVKVAADGEFSKAGTGSLIVSRGRAHIQRLQGTVLVAGEDTIIEGVPDGGIFVNATLIMNSTFGSIGRQRPRSVKVRDLPLEEAPVHPLSKRLTVVGVVYPEVRDSDIASSLRRASALMGREALPSPPTQLVFRLDGRRYAAEVGKPIVDQAEKPVSDLADWKLSYLDDDLAIFSNSEADAVVRTQGK